MPSVKIGTMDKKINSTKTSFSGTSLSCKLKHPCGMQSPVFIVQGLSKGTLYNYASFEGRYYWVDEVVYLTNDIQEVHCTLDPLATYKADIKATTGFINFGPKSLAHASLKLVDSRLQPDLMYGYQKKYSNAFDTYFENDPANWAVIIKVVDFPVGGGTGGGVQTLVGTLSDFNELLQAYCTDLDADITSLTGFEKLVGKFAGLSNALESLKYAVLIPFKASYFQNGGYGGNIGGYTISGNWQWCKHWGGSPIVSPAQDIEVSVPQYVQDNPWLLNPEFTKVSISTPGGQTDISDSIFCFGSTNKITLSVRFGFNIEGLCFLDVRDKQTDTRLAYHSWNVAVDLKDYVYKADSSFTAGARAGLKIGALGVAGIGAAGGAITSIGTAVGSRAAEAGAERMFESGRSLEHFGKTLSSIDTKTISNGISGASAAFNVASGAREFNGGGGLPSLYINSDDPKDIFVLTADYFIPRIITSNTYNDFCDEYGWPVMKYGDLSANGPYQMAGATCKADAPANALSTINSTLNSLIIIE